MAAYPPDKSSTLSTQRKKSYSCLPSEHTLHDPHHTAVILDTLFCNSNRSSDRGTTAACTSEAGGCDAQQDDLVNGIFHLLNYEIVHGVSYPFVSALDKETFLSYFFSHNCFVLRLRTPLKDDLIVRASKGKKKKNSLPKNHNSYNNGNSGMEKTRMTLDHEEEEYNMGKSLVGAFYIKPNFPGRSNHICNGGFVVNPFFRRRGAAELMAMYFPILAKELGYLASYFNLVYTINKPSIALWEKLSKFGYQRLCTVKNAGRFVCGQNHEMPVSQLQECGQDDFLSEEEVKRKNENCHQSMFQNNRRDGAAAVVVGGVGEREKIHENHPSAIYSDAHQYYCDFTNVASASSVRGRLAAKL